MADEGTGGRFSPLGNASEVERRQAARYLAEMRVTCYPAGGGLGGGRVARVRNISRTGIGLVVDRHWRRGCPGSSPFKAARGWRCRGRSRNDLGQHDPCIDPIREKNLTVTDFGAGAGPCRLVRLLTKWLGEPRNKDLRQRLDRQIRTY